MNFVRVTEVKIHHRGYFEFQNYCFLNSPVFHMPISVLPILSKILVKHIHDSLMDFLINHSLLHETRSGFRPSFSCEIALLRMVS